jgi:hypothetical protein
MSSIALEVGDSGSWVVNKDTLEVVGHAVASDAFGEAHIIPMSATFRDIKARLGVSSVSLPSVEEVHSWMHVDSGDKRIIEGSKITPSDQQTQPPQKESITQQTGIPASQALPGTTTDEAYHVSSASRNSEDQFGFPPLEDAGRSEHASTTLKELTRLVQLAKDQDKKLSSTRTHMTGCLVSAALSERLARSGDASYRTLVDHFRADDTKSFATIYDVNVDLRVSFYAFWRQSLLEPPPWTTKRKHSATPFLEQLSERSREAILHFVARIRTDPEYLADLILGLSSANLDGLLKYHKVLDVTDNDTVLPSRSFTAAAGGSGLASSTRYARTPTISHEHLVSLERDDPLAILIHVCFHSPMDDLRRTDVWAGVCARLISEKDASSDRCIGVLLMIWTTLREWRGRKNMESYLMKILHDGAFLLEKPEDDAGIKTYSPPTSKESIRAEEFYESAVEGLLCVIDDREAGGIPEGLIELGNAIIGKLDPKLHVATRRFLLSKWLFSRFCLTATIHPEVRISLFKG